MVRSVVKVVERNDLEAGRADHPAKNGWSVTKPMATQVINALLRLSLLRTLQPDDQRNSQGKLLRSVDHTLRDVVTTHDAAEDVDEDALDLGVRHNDFERLLDRLGSSTSVSQQ